MCIGVGGLDVKEGSPEDGVSVFIGLNEEQLVFRFRHSDLHSFAGSILYPLIFHIVQMCGNARDSGTVSHAG